MSGRILVVDDEPDMCRLLAADLNRRGFEIVWHTSAERCWPVLRQEEVDVVLADINLPGMSGIELCQRVKANRPDILVIMMTAFGSVETAVAAIRAGAYDFVTKPVDLDILAISLERAVNHRFLREEVNRLNQSVDPPPAFGDIIGESSIMREMFSQLSRIADTETTVLITGESGSGKELAARALHEGSRRRQGPFVAINCSALPEALLESELFGYKPGAFTDAKTTHIGLFRQSNLGTLFLDEIGDLPLTLQPKLLRAIEQRRVRPLGGTTEIAFDSRIITATHRDLEAEVAKGTFRQDLFYRLNVFQIDLPPLRVRGADVLLLCRRFIDTFAKRLGKDVNGISKPAAEKLLGYDWPGNVRELSNAMEHAVALARREKLTIEDLPKKIQAFENHHIDFSAGGAGELVSLEEIERRYILHVLKSVDGNQSSAARILGIDRKTLYRKLQRFGADQN